MREWKVGPETPPPRFTYNFIMRVILSKEQINMTANEARAARDENLLGREGLLVGAVALPLLLPLVAAGVVVVGTAAAEEEPPGVEADRVIEVGFDDEIGELLCSAIGELLCRGGVWRGRAEAASGGVVET